MSACRDSAVSSLRKGLLLVGVALSKRGDLSWINPIRRKGLVFVGTALLS